MTIKFAFETVLHKKSDGSFDPATLTALASNGDANPHNITFWLARTEATGVKPVQYQVPMGVIAAYTSQTKDVSLGDSNSSKWSLTGISMDGVMQKNEMGMNKWPTKIVTVESEPERKINVPRNTAPPTFPPSNPMYVPQDYGTSTNTPSFPCSKQDTDTKPAQGGDGGVTLSIVGGIAGMVFIACHPDWIMLGTYYAIKPFGYLLGCPCFVTTAAYGKPDHPMVKTFRALRDEVLVNHKAGQKFIGWYNTNGPRIAKFIENKPVAMWGFRCVLTPLAYGVKATRATSRAVKAIIKHRTPEPAD